MKYVLFLVAFVSFYSCNTNQSNSDKNSSETDSIINSLEVDNVPTVKPHSNSVRDYQELYPDGRIKIEGNYDSDQKRSGLWISYYENGLKWSETVYSAGNKNGHSITFYPNGKIRYVGEYTNDDKSGEWKFYDEAGNVVKTENY